MLNLLVQTCELCKEDEFLGLALYISGSIYSLTEWGLMPFIFHRLVEICYLPGSLI